MIRCGIVLFAVGMLGTTAHATDFAREVAPQKWVEPLAPEALPPLKYPSYFNDLDKAKAQAFAGRYRLSLQTLRWIVKINEDVIVLKAHDLAAIGWGEEALKLLDGTVSEQGRIERARVLHQLGQPVEALAELKSILQTHPKSLAGHYEVGRISEEVGDFETARLAYGWFVDSPQDFLNRWRAQGEKLIDTAEDATLVGKALDRWATLNGEYQKDPGLHDTILDFFVKSYDVIDRQYWAAHVAAAEYFLSHDDATNAKKELAAALAGNPNSAEAFRLVGLIAVQGFDFNTAEAATEAIRQSNPTSVQADLLQVRNLLRQRQPKGAEQVANAILKRLPKNAEAMSLLAGAEALQLHDEATKNALAAMDAENPRGAQAYFEVAEQLAAMRQYPRSAAMYKVAIERAPWWTAARNGLGLLYTQSGDEDLARATLDAAHEMDPFNLETTNYLRLLDELAAFDKKESAHFIVFYNGKLDPLIPEYFNDYLESVYPQVTADFKTEPPVKTFIEVFPTHDSFSVRTTGSPWIGTVGASTGRVIAMVAPRKGENTMGTFNWSQVLRHEFTHTVTLAATDNRISHWMTEGLAVMEEKSPLQWPWVPMLYSAVTRHELFDMDALTWAFIRPRRPSDRQLAYAESFWVCTYITQKFGHDAILKMLAEFKAGGLQEDVFAKILGRSQSQFFSEFSIWAAQQVAGWGYDSDSVKKYDELRDRGEELIKAKQYVEAVPVWEEIAKLRPVDELPQQRLAGLYLTKSVNEPTKAIEHLTILHKVDLKDDRFAKRIAGVYRDQGDFTDGKEWALRAVYVDPYDLSAHKLLGDLAEKAGDQVGVEREARVIPILEKWIEAMKTPSAAQ